ncbi:MAG TPA: hypothetical protein VNW97_13485 [Candidatus Saccharimonadales bacterium]|jgi:hypothetical protein|nr:hypothetical protein [Candidatus Saccharimonadales bacterium]
MAEVQNKLPGQKNEMVPAPTSPPIPDSSRTGNIKRQFGTMAKFYFEWLKHILRSWSIVDTVATITAIVVPVIARVRPELGAKMGDLIWQIPVGIFAILGGIRLFLAPYWIYKEKDDEAFSYQLLLEDKQREADELKKILENYKLVPVGESAPKPNIKIEIVGIGPVMRNPVGTWDSCGETFARPRCLTATGVIAYMHNAPAVKGDKTATAYDVVATVKFYNENINLAGSVARAYWLGHSANNVKIESGEDQAILLATCHGEKIATYNNHRTEPLRLPRLPSQLARWIPPRIDPGWVAVDRFVDIEITILSTDTGETLAREEARLSRDGDSFSIAKLDVKSI